MGNVGYIVLENSLLVKVGDKTHNISKTDSRYEKVYEAIKAKKLDEVPALINPDNLLAKEGFTVVDGLVSYKGESLPSILSNQFINLKNNGTDFLSIVNFWFNLKNRETFKDSQQLVTELIECNGYPITKDGFIIVYNNYRVQEKQLKLKNDSATRFYDYSHVESAFTEYFNKRKDLTQIIEAVFGFSSKKLYKFVYEGMFSNKASTVDASVLHYGLALKELFSPNNLFLIMEKKLLPVKARSANYFTRLNSFFKEIGKTKDGKFSEKRIINYLEKKYDAHQLFGAMDCLDQIKAESDMVIDFATLDFQSIEALYSYLDNEVKKLRVGDFKLLIDQNFPEAFKLHGLHIDKLQVIMPMTNFDLTEWSQKMGNCIHGYGKRVKAKETLVFAVLDSDTGEMLYNVEITGEKVRQFNAHRNGSPIASHKAKVMEVLKNKGIIR